MSKTETMVGKRSGLLLIEAQGISGEIVDMLKPYCERIEVAGSIRRKRPVVNDVDIVLVPSDPWHLFEKIRGVGNVGAAGAKLQRFIYKGVQVDIYIATREIWATLLLIRTGSARNNIRLAGIAKAKGWYLKANGEGLLNEAGQRIAGDTESSIYTALGLPYQQPTERD